MKNFLSVNITLTKTKKMMNLTMMPIMMIAMPFIKKNEHKIWTNLSIYKNTKMMRIRISHLIEGCMTCQVQKNLSSFRHIVWRMDQSNLAQKANM